MDVVAIGELLIDFTSKKVDADGYPTMEAHPGGAPANFLAALSKFGAKTALLGKVGNDAFGKMLLKTLHNSGIETAGMVMDETVFTTLAFVTLDATGAGDIFGGSAVWKLLQTGKTPEALCEAELREITAFACTSASLSTTRPGGVSSVPSYNEILDKLA